jgi:hypothetical protein
MEVMEVKKLWKLGVRQQFKIQNLEFKISPVNSFFEVLSIFGDSSLRSE